MTDHLEPSYKEAWLSGPGGHHFYTRTYPATTPQPVAVALFVHGYADHSTRHEHDHVEYANRGITMFTYDQRGFGRTALDKEHRSRGSAYGKTDSRHIYGDMAWWIERLSDTYPTLPLFLVAYSAGAGFASYFCAKPEYERYVAKISGIIALSPLTYLTYPAPTLLSYAVRVLNWIAPHMPVPTPMPEERFSRNPAAITALKEDTLRKSQGTPAGLIAIIDEPQALLHTGYRGWPKYLPYLLIHGTADQVNSCDGAAEFFDKLDAIDKRLSLYEGAYHDLVNEIDDIPQRVSRECTDWIQAHSKYIA